MRLQTILAGGMLFLSACTTIHIKEQDVFDVKRTIHLDAFNNMPYEAEEIQITTPDSIKLQAWFIDHPNAEKTVLYFGGNGFVIESSYQIITSILKQNVDLLVFNYRGYGRNNGTPGIEGIKTDALAAYDYLVSEKGIDKNNIILHGHSLGTFAASYSANKRESRALVLESPVTSVNDWSASVLPWFIKPFFKIKADSILTDISNIHYVENLDIPLLLIAGKDDKITPPELAEKLYHRSTSKKKNLLIIKNGGHNDLPEIDIYGKALNRFYQNHEPLKTLSDSLIDHSSLPE